MGRIKIGESDVGNVRLHAANLIKQAPAAFLRGQSWLFPN